MALGKKNTAEIEKKKIGAEIKRRQKQEERAAAQAEKEAAKRMEHKLIQSTQLSVPIRDVLEGVVITKDDRYLKILEFGAQNFLMFSTEERNRITEDITSMLRIVPVKIQFKVFSRKAKTEELLSSMRASREIETNPMCIRMQDEYIDLVTNTALRDGVTRRFLIILEYMDDVGSDGTDFNEICASLNQLAARIRTYMETAGNPFIKSCEKDSGINELLYEILNRQASEEEPFVSRVNKVYSHYVEEMRKEGIDDAPPIPSTEFIAPAWIDYKHPRYIVIDNKFYTFGYFSADRFPNFVVAGWLSGFVNASEGIDIDIFMERVPREKVENSIGRLIRNNRAKMRTTSDTTTEANDVENKVQGGFYLLDGLANNDEFFYSSIVVTVTADNLKDLDYRWNELEKMAHSMKMKLRRTHFQMEEAFESTLPLCKLSPSINRKAKRNMLSGGAASYYPFISFELQDPNGIMLGVNSENNSLVAIDVFDTQRHANANGAILGKSGYGKTFTAQLLAIRMRLQNIQTFIITPMKGTEDYKRACDQIDGQFIAMGPGSPHSINIFDIRVPDREGLMVLDDGMEDMSLLARKVQDLHTFMRLVVRDLTQEEEQLIDKYLYKVYRDKGITEDNDSVFVPGTKKYKRFPILGDLYNAIENDPALKKVANILSSMVIGSLSVYNKETNVDLDNKYIVFDMNGTKGQTLILSMFITLDFVWSKIKENRLAKKAVFIDEAWILIGSQSNELAAEYVKEIFKTIRAFGGAAFVMTQEISDFFSLKDGEYGKAIIGNADTKICLHLDATEAYRVSDLMNLTPDEEKKIQKLSRGHALIATGNSKLFVDIKASPFETDVITTDPQYLRNKIYQQQLQERHAEYSEQMEETAFTDDDDFDLDIEF